MVEGTLCCKDCGRHFTDASEHFIPKCALQHKIRTRVLCIQYFIKMLKRELQLLENLVNEDYSQCLNKEEVDL